MENAEAIEYGAERMDIVVEPVRGFRLKRKQRAPWLQKLADFILRFLWSGKVMNAIASRNEVEAAVRIEVAHRLRDELQAATQLLRSRRRRRDIREDGALLIGASEVRFAGQPADLRQQARGDNERHRPGPPRGAPTVG
jgi:hypothetical protein